MVTARSRPPYGNIGYGRGKLSSSNLLLFFFWGGRLIPSAKHKYEHQDEIYVAGAIIFYHWFWTLFTMRTNLHCFPLSRVILV